MLLQPNNLASPKINLETRGKDPPRLLVEADGTEKRRGPEKCILKKKIFIQYSFVYNFLRIDSLKSSDYDWCVPTDTSNYHTTSSLACA